MFRIVISEDSPFPKFRQIADQIRRAIAKGELRPGDQLPTQEELLSECGAHIETVLRAYRQLEEDGLVVSRPPRGRFVADRPRRISKSERQKRLKSHTQTFMASIASLGLSLNEVLQAVRDNWRGRKNR